MKLSLTNLVIPPWARVVWRLAPWLGLLIALSGLSLTRSTLALVREHNQTLYAQTELASKTQELEWTQRLSIAQGTYLQTFKNLSNIKDKSDEETKAFAATPAGAVSCLTADRVREIAAHRAAVASASAPEGSARPVPASSDPTTGP